MIDLDTRLLRAFVAIYQLGGVTAAARQIGVTQPTMSGHLKRLRSHFKDPLFLWTNGRMSPTARANEIQPIALEIAAGLDQLTAARSGWSYGTSERTFRVMASGYVQTVVSKPIDDAVRPVAPFVGIEFVQPVAGKYQPMCDAYIFPAWLTPEGHQHKLLFRDRLTCVADRSLISAPDRLTLDLFCQLEHILLAPSPSPPHSAVDAALARIGRTRRVARTSSELSEVWRLLARADRLAMLPARLASGLSENLLVTLPPIALDPIEFLLSGPRLSGEDEGGAWFMLLVAKAFEGLADA